MMRRTLQDSTASLYRSQASTDLSPQVMRHAMLVDAITAKHAECAVPVGINWPGCAVAETGGHTVGHVSVTEPCITPW